MGSWWLRCVLPLQLRCRLMVWLFRGYVARLKTILQPLGSCQYLGYCRSSFTESSFLSRNPITVIWVYVSNLWYVSHGSTRGFWRWTEGEDRCKSALTDFTSDFMGSSSCCGNKLERRSLRGRRESLGAFQTLGKLKRNSVIPVRRRGPRCGASTCCRNADALKHQSKILQQILREPSFENRFHRSQQRVTRE